jgi:hypothetical protein
MGRIWIRIQAIQKILALFAVLLGEYVHMEVPLLPTPLEHKLKLNSVAFKSASELYRPSDRRLSAKLVPTFAERVSRCQRNGSPGR